MLEIVLITSILFLIAVFFYKQAVTEFRINQIEWTQRSHLPKLYSEKLPIVIRTIPPATFWTHSDIHHRYDTLSLFNEMSLSTWSSTVTSTTVCPWRYSHAEQLARLSGISVWAAKWINPSMIGYHRFWTIPLYHCWMGNKGLHKTMAWTYLFCTEGELHVTIMPETMEQFLPAVWLNLFPADITEHDTPFLKDLKYIDIIVRPGTALVMPPHWLMSWVSGATTSGSERSGSERSGAERSGAERSGAERSGAERSGSMACTISYHTPISYLAFHVSPFVQH